MISTIIQRVFGLLHNQSESYIDLMPSLTDQDTVQSIREQQEKSSFEVLCSAKSLTPSIRIDYKHPIMRHLEPDLNTNLVSCSSGLMIILDEFYNGNQLSLFCSLLYKNTHTCICVCVCASAQVCQHACKYQALSWKERSCEYASWLKAYVSVGSIFKCLLPKVKSGNAMYMLTQSDKISTKPSLLASHKGCVFQITEMPT